MGETGKILLEKLSLGARVRYAYLGRSVQGGRCASAED